MRSVLIALLYLPACAGSAVVGPNPKACPIFQCTAQGTGRAQGTVASSLIKGHRPGSILWRATSDPSTTDGLSQLGCVSNQHIVVCGPERRAMAGAGSTVISAFTSAGKIAYSLDVGASEGGAANSASMPIVDSDSDVWWNDARHIFLGNSTGDTVWDDTFRSYVQGDFFPATITTGTAKAPYEVLFIAMRNGFVFAYNTEGAPVAGVYLANTTQALSATFGARSAPVTQGCRVLLLAESLATPGAGRLYAFDVRDVDVDRIAQAFYMDFDIPPGVAPSSGSFNDPYPLSIFRDGQVLLVTRSDGTEALGISLVSNALSANASTQLTTRRVAGLPTLDGMSAADIVVVEDHTGTGFWLFLRRQAPMLVHVQVETATVDFARGLQDLLPGEWRNSIITTRPVGYTTTLHPQLVLAIAKADGAAAAVSLTVKLAVGSGAAPTCTLAWITPLGGSRAYGQVAIMPKAGLAVFLTPKGPIGVLL